MPDSPRQLLVGRPEREISPLRRATDVAAVLVVGPAVLVLVLLLAVAVKLDSPGPAFYRNRRLGAGGRPFSMLKLRTMVEDAELLREDLMHLNTLAFPDFKVERDPRVTRVGRWLRVTTLDELPQLWHVLCGEMTLVGPRASFVAVSSYELWQTERLEYRPGLFGSWQASERGTAAFGDRCRMDIRDRRQGSLRGDVALSVASLRSVLTARGRH